MTKRYHRSGFIFSFDSFNSFIHSFHSFIHRFSFATCGERSHAMCSAAPLNTHANACSIAPQGGLRSIAKVSKTQTYSALFV